MSYKARSALIILILGICFDINLSSQELSFQGNDIEESGAPNVKPTLLTGEQLYTACSGCHSISVDGAHRVGPNLYGINQQPAASRQGVAYSDALTATKIVWDRPALIGWVLSAEAMVPNTWMLYHNHLSPIEAERLVDHIISASD